MTTNYREILRLNNLGLNKTDIASAAQCARNTVSTTLERAKACGLQWPLPEGMSDKELAEKLFPSLGGKTAFKMPDYAHVHREMQRHGVTLTLLWLEYCDQCKAEGAVPYQSTQFNKYYNDYLNRVNATMHLNHKPGEVMQVDWAGDTAAMVDTDTGEFIPAYRNMTFEDRLGLLVDAEWNARKGNHLRKLIRQATYSDPAACLENVEYIPDRKLKQEELLRLGSCNYIHEHHNVILLGATGSGKTYLACALGMAATRQFLPVKYIRLPDLLVDFSIARGNGTIRKLMVQYKKYALLIIDVWMLYPLKESECRDLLEIMESRYKRASTILCSQFDIPGWRDKLADPILADAICDRIVHDAYTIIIGGQESMRKRKGLKE